MRGDMKGKPPMGGRAKPMAPGGAFFPPGNGRGFVPPGAGPPPFGRYPGPRFPYPPGMFIISLLLTLIAPFFSLFISCGCTLCLPSPPLLLHLLLSSRRQSSYVSFPSSSAACEPCIFSIWRRSSWLSSSVCGTEGGEGGERVEEGGVVKRRRSGWRKG